MARSAPKPKADAMRQIWITRGGPPEVLAIKDAPDPQPKAGEVRIRVEASGINFADILGRMGLYPDLPPMPVVPGYEVSGRVDVVGPGTDGDWIARDVIAMTRFGGYADMVCVPASQVFARPLTCPLWKAPPFPSTISPPGSLSWSWVVSSAARPFSSIRRAAASASPRRKSPSTSART